MNALPLWRQFVLNAEHRIRERGGWAPGIDPVEQIAAQIVTAGDRDDFVNAAARGKRSGRTQKALYLDAVLRIAPDPKGRRIRRKPAPGVPTGPDCIPFPETKPPVPVLPWWRRVLRALRILSPV